MRAGVVCVAIVAVLYPARGGAQMTSLTEREVLDRLTAESPRVQAARAGVDTARSEVLAARRWPNPSVSFTHEAAGGVSESMLTVAQPLPVSGRRELEVRAASARVDAAGSRADERVRRLRADTRLAFVDVWSAQERERELARSVERVRELAGVLARREDAGDAAGFDRLRAERELLDLDTSRAAAATDRAHAQLLLAGYIGLDDPASLQAATPPRSPAGIPPTAELIAHADTARPDLRALANDLDAAGFAERAAHRRRVPEPEIVAGTKSSNGGTGDTGAIVGVRVALPLLDGGRVERAAASARASQARAEAAALRQAVRAQVAAWRATVLERRATADRYRAAMDAGADIERIAQVSYDAGERGILELLDAHRTSTSARVRLIELDAAVRQAEIELEYASAWEIR
jgi:outer membrane protein, heavy metal efflux system